MARDFTAAGEERDKKRPTSFLCRRSLSAGANTIESLEKTPSERNSEKGKKEGRWKRMDGGYNWGNMHMCLYC
jgi:hypothetical protein